MIIAVTMVMLCRLHRAGCKEPGSGTWKEEREESFLGRVVIDKASQGYEDTTYFVLPTHTEALPCLLRQPYFKRVFTKNMLVMPRDRLEMRGGREAFD